MKVSEADAPPVQWVFGVSGLNSSTPQLTRTDDAVGKTWSMDSSTGLITTGFDTFFNFERITDSSGNIFARIPKMYQSFSGGDTLKIANYKVDDTFNLYPSFLGENGEELDYFDYGCYKASTNGSKLSSRSGVTPTYWKIISEFRTEARANSETNYLYFQKDIRARQLIQDLFMVVFATRNTEDVQGTSWKEYGSNTGDTDSITNDTLSNPLMCCGLNQTTKGFKLFGIEDICGNGWEFVDGIYFSSASIYISYRPSQFADSTSNKIRLSYSRPTSSNYISKLGYDASNPCINYPVATSGSPSTYYCDKVWYNSSGTILYDGAASFSANDGVWYASGDYDASRSRVNIGSRLCRQPA